MLDMNMAELLEYVGTLEQEKKSLIEERSNIIRTHARDIGFADEQIELQRQSITVLKSKYDELKESSSQGPMG